MFGAPEHLLAAVGARTFFSVITYNIRGSGHK
jgi:hypothetical protein